MKRNIIIFLLFICLKQTISQDLTTYQLPKNVLPDKYSLWLKIDLDNVVFNGNLTISIRVLESTNVITLNAKEINVLASSILLTNTNNQANYLVSNIVARNAEEMINLVFTQNIPIGSYNLYLQFSAIIRSDLRGLYRSSYDFNGQTRYLAATQMEPLYGRLVFPCFDEPSFKAIFEVNIHHATKYVAISNMPIKYQSQSTEGVDFTLTSFDDTPIMSTYLLAFVVYQDYFGYTDAINSHIKIYASSHESHRTQYAHSFTVKSLAALESFLNRTYQLPKLDLINIPDFTFGAMENWGLITFRDPYLFRDNDVLTIPVRTQQSGALLISHELAHMWFGNEVSPDSWQYVWLSEGFARYFEYYITDEIEPEWKLWDQFIVSNIQSAFSQDDVISARAMSEPVYLPSVINGMFNYIVYAKSVSVIRMMEKTMGLFTFQQALRPYLNELSYKTTIPDNLFTHFQNAINLNANLQYPATFKEIFETWSNNPGYPLLQVNRNVNTSQITFSQSRFILDPNVNVANEPNRYIPISYSNSVERDIFSSVPKLWLNTTTTTINVQNLTENVWVLANIGATGYYRVNYDLANWKLLALALREPNSQLIDFHNRAQLIDDSINLAKATKIGFNVALDLMVYLENEMHYSPWASFANSFDYLERHIRGLEYHDRFQRFMHNITNKSYQTVRVNTTERVHLTRMHRLNVARIACLSGLSICIEDIHSLLSQSIDGVIEELQSFVYCSAARYSDELAENLLAKALDLHQQSRANNLAQIYRLFSGIGCSRNEEFLSHLLNLTILTDSTLLPADRTTLFKSVQVGGINGTKLALIFLRENYSTILQRYASIPNIFDSSFSNAIVTNDLMYQFTLFGQTYVEELTEDVRTAYNRVVATSYQNLVWLNINEQTVNSWLQENIAGSTSAKLLGSAILMLLINLIKMLV